MKSYDDFLNALAARESGGKYTIVNSLGYLGKYQMGLLALTDAGYYANGKWTGKDNVYSKEDFLYNPIAQENAIRDFEAKVWNYIKYYDLDKYIGNYINGTKITASSLLAGYHLKGIGKSMQYIIKNDITSDLYKGLRAYLESNGVIDGSDAYGTKISEYINKFSGYLTPFDIQKQHRSKYFKWKCEGKNSCNKCRERDSKIYQYGVDKEPPLHYNCDCTIEDYIPHTKSELFDLELKEYKRCFNRDMNIFKECIDGLREELRELDRKYR